MTVQVSERTAVDAPVTSAEPYEKQPQRDSLLRFWPELRPFRPTIFASVLAALVAVLCGVAIPLLTKRIIDGPIAHRDLDALWVPALIVLAMGMLEAAGIWGRRWLVAKAASQFEISMRAKLFRKLQSLSIGRHDGWDSGQLLSRAITDMSTVRRFVAFIGPFILINTVTLILGFAVLVWFSPVLAVIQFVASIPLVYFCIRFEAAYGVASRRAQDQSGDVATTVEESVQGIRVLKAFGRSPFAGSRFGRQARDLQLTELLKVRYGATLWAAMVGVPTVAGGLILGVGGYLVATGSMTLGTLVASITMATFLHWPINAYGFLLAEMNNTRTAADRFWEIIDTPVDIVEPDQPAELPVPLAGELRFDRVSFTFPESNRELLHGISLKVHPGETVALVGATGAGKTALLNLVPRLYDVTAGAITIDGVDVRDVRLADLRSVVTAAFEDPVLFSASVRENVALGHPDATDADVRLALEVAEATEFVDKLPWGMDTRVGEQGLSLSGGQRQRLALARAVLGAGAQRGARILVLDDPLSALDVETEERVQANLRRVLKRSTTLLVAHRPSTAALADRVVLLEHGRIAAQGSHERLLGTNARYRELMGGEHDG